ncbi:MAG: DUF6506 family protein [Pseudonocardiaceae bacterium]|nr:DUF6506 family protein [Pseudonocardiaceae bacterium]
MFRNLFMVRVPGGDPADRVVHEDSLSRTVIVPVPDAAAAAAVAAGFGEVDLIELYAGLGIEAAAAVLAEVPAGPVGFAGDVDSAPHARVAMLFADPAADPAVHRWVFGDVTVVAVPSAAAASRIATELVAAGAQRVELCGGMGPVPAAAVRAVVDVPVTTVLFGFESLPAIAAYRAHFEQAVASAG